MANIPAISHLKTTLHFVAFLVNLLSFLLSFFSPASLSACLLISSSLTLSRVHTAVATCPITFVFPPLLTPFVGSTTRAENTAALALEVGSGAAIGTDTVFDARLRSTFGPAEMGIACARPWLDCLELICGARGGPTFG